VNLIGEHTDYTGGFVLPVAIPLATYVAAAPACDGCLHLFSETKGPAPSVRVTDLTAVTPRGDWTDYVLGVARELARAGHPPPPLFLFIASEIPEGAGLSSSAALEIAAALALLHGTPLDGRTLARAARQAERDFAGIPVGIMDQFVSVFGEPNAAVLIDCRSESHRAVRLPGGLEVVAIDSRVKHALGASAYRTRVEECTAALQAIRVSHPHVDSLRDATPAMAEAIADERIRRRARHVTTENARVLEFVEAASQGDATRMGALIAASHRSLRDDYEVSCPELDLLVDLASRVEGVFGARLTGGGFGGCTVNLLDSKSSAQLERQLAPAYRAATGLDCRFYRVHPAAGAGEFF
jgi:galactokinase